MYERENASHYLLRGIIITLYYFKDYGADTFWWVVKIKLDDYFFSIKLCYGKAFEVFVVGISVIAEDTNSHFFP